MEPFFRSIEQEVGKPRFETLTTELVTLLSACRWHERNAARVLRPRRVRGGSIWQIGQTQRVTRVPLGRVGVIATWNYPVQLLGIQLVQAVVGGNRVIVKPSERSPESQRLLLERAVQAEPPVEIEWVSSDREAGSRLLEEHELDHVVFTGSTGVGRAVASKLAETLTPSTLELSGCDSCLMLADADIEQAAASFWFALSVNAGRTCLAPRRAIVVGDGFDRFVDALERRARRVPVGHAVLDDQTRGLVDEAVAGGGRLIDLGDQGVRVVADPPREGGLFRGEHFGAASTVVHARDLEEALGIHRSIEQQLATSVFTRDVAAARRLAPGLGSTTVTINDAVIPTGHPGASIGGHGPSGWGVSRGELGLLSMTRPVFVSTTGSKIRTPLAPPPSSQVGAFESFVRRWYGG